MSTERALVLGGGGVAGIAWAAGLLAGLARAGVSLADADVVVGTSAGSVVGAWLATGVDPEEMLARQVDPARQTPELSTDVDLGALAARFGEALAGASVEEVRRQVGAMALATSTVPEQARREVLAARLPVHDWPAGLVVTVVDAQTGERSALDASCGFPLVDVVAASCAVPGVWPPVTLGERRYVDGGVHNVLNADLAAGAARTLVLAPLGAVGDGPLGAGWDAARPLLGVRVLLLEPDEASRAAFGANPLDPATRTPAAQAGLAQAPAVVDAVREVWR
ncbi:MAG: patatin [Frankiales bacterium]|nr:patatin [Frankiales bacterium]